MEVKLYQGLLLQKGQIAKPMCDLEIDTLKGLALPYCKCSGLKNLIWTYLWRHNGAASMVNSSFQYTKQNTVIFSWTL